MSGGPMGIGTSALQAFQRALATTGHNIANATTEGYSRQRVELSARPPQASGSNFFGTGVQAGNVSRNADAFVESQLRTATSANANSSVFYDQAKRVDNLLADADSGLSPGLQKFFSAMQDVANDPTSTAARQVLLSEADSLVDRFRSLDQRLSEQRELVNGQIRSTVKEIDELAKAVASLNGDIASANGRGIVPNDLLDQRDVLVRELAERIDVTVTEQDDGALNLFVGNGQNLVLGSRVSTLTAQALGEDPSEMRIGFSQTGANPVDITRFMTGGRLGALLEVRSAVLDTAQNALGRTAVGVAEAFNEQHRLGQDLDGVIGRDFFRVPDPQILSNQPGLAEPGVTIDDIDKLGTGDFRLVAVANGEDELNWQLRSVPGGEIIEESKNREPEDPPFGSSVGLNIDTDKIEGNPGPKAGDSFLIRPTRTAAAQIATVIDDPRALAAATPSVKVEAGEENSDAALTSARFEPREVLAIESLAKPNVEFGTNDDGATFAEFSGVDLHSIISDDAVIVDGNLIITLETSQGTWILEWDGIPEDGDSFSLSPEPAGPGDNSNALALGALQEERLLDGGNATLEGSYNTLIAEVGTRTRQAEVASRAQASQLQQAQEQRESISGVNLDEEAANLLRFQQAYQAAAQVISVTNSLFDTLIGAVRR